MLQIVGLVEQIFASFLWKKNVHSEFKYFETLPKQLLKFAQNITVVLISTVSNANTIRKTKN